MMSILLLCVSVLPFFADAFPTAAGYCQSGMNGINQGAHASARNLIGGGYIGDAGFEVLIDGQQVFEGVRFDLEAGVSHSIQLVSTRNIMRGFLLRLESSDGQSTKYSLSTTDSNAKVNFYCTNLNVGGLSHVSRDPKTRIDGTLYLANASEDLTLDVSIVVSTISSYSSAEWYYSPLKLRAVAPNITISYETAAPTPSPTKAPCLADGESCTNNGTCCTGFQCIRTESNDTFAPGYCQGSDISTSPPISYFTNSSTSPPSNISEVSSGKYMGASCFANTECLSNRCILLNDSWGGFCWY